MSLNLAYNASLRRGQALRETGRYLDACRFFGEAIQADPDEPQAYLELALAHGELPGGKTASLQAIDQAVRRAPNSAHFLGCKAYLLSRFGRQKEALEFADLALGLSLFCPVALLARCNAYTRLAKWAEAEEAARRILEFDAEDVGALNLLAQALRFRGRTKESGEIVAQILARVPNDAFGHANAGYDALKMDDHRRANHHFLQALRFDPDCEHARSGLLQSLRARCLIYRLNFKIETWLGKPGDPVEQLFAPVLRYFTMAFTLQPLGNFFLLLDPLGRRSLRPKERLWALFTGWAACLLLLALALSHQLGLAIVIGGYLVLFALSVYLPLWADAHREKQSDPAL